MRNHAAVLFAAVSILLTTNTFAATPAPEMQKRVRAATFEVVVPKPADTGVTYERPLPLELLPFAERNDKYWSVGTAFAIAPGTLVSAAHVLTAALQGAGGPPALRAADGTIYQIGRVLKFSLHQDFAVFTTSSTPAGMALETDTAITLDEPVFAVGNALGEGVVIRDGLLTSLTPEDQDGRWKWLRYSAATSPGNSGGPLLNATGKVIGVVIGKSPGENLNYALPIEHVLSAPQVARVDTRFPFRIPILRDSIVGKYDITIPLPLPLDQFAPRLQASALDVYRSQRAALLAKNAAELLPRGKADKLLASVDAAYCPMIVAQTQDHTWELDENSRDTTDLPDDGQICTRKSAEMDTFSIVRSAGASDSRFQEDTRIPMDLLLKGLKMPRNVGSESVLITSLGAATRDSEFRDRFGRRWRLRIYALPFADVQLVSMFLPTPDGYVGMLQIAARGGLELIVDQMSFVADYFYVSYSGTLAQWKAFLARKATLPPVFDAVTLARDEATGLHFRSRRVDFDVPPNLMKLTDASKLQLQTSYSLEAGKLVWDVGATYVTDTALDDNLYVGVIRQPKPSSSAGKELTERWTSMLAGTGDFADERGHDTEYKKAWRRSAIGSGYRPGAKVDPAANVLYEVYSVVSKMKLPRQVDTMQQILTESMRVKER
jgi:serine protease Do